MKLHYLLIAFIGLAVACKPVNSSTKAGNNIKFTSLTFHSSVCNGTCPDLSLNIYSDNRIELMRTLFKRKGQADTTRSGSFKGQLEQKEMDRFLTLVKEVDWETVTFPDVTCCDRPVKTIIISYNGKTKRLKSMTPHESTQKLIYYLTELGTKVQLPEYNQPIDFEVVDNK